MSAVFKSLVLDTWAGCRYQAVGMVGETPKKAQIRTVRATGYGSIGEGQAKRGDLTRVKQGSNASLEAAFALIQRPPDEPISVINRTMSLTA